MEKRRLVSLILIIFMIFNLFLCINLQACKDIIAVGDSTDGEYNLLIKVRDPTRQGPQVLVIVPEGQTYTYPHPWTAKPMDFTVDQKYICVTTKGDTYPNIVKPAMALSASGLAYGDADTNSFRNNPTKYGWDDFDWIRYACQTAETEDEAVELMTEDVVKKLHAQAVSENLFVVGPDKGYFIEGDALHYAVTEVNDFIVGSNYPKELWKKQLIRRLLIAPNLDTKLEKWAFKGRVIRLYGFFGVKIVDIQDDSITVRPYPFEFNYDEGASSIINRKSYYKIKLGESKTVGEYGIWGHFRVTLLDIDKTRAKISLCSEFYAWDQRLSEIVEEKYGKITVNDMMNWSRLHTSDLEGLRGMCEEGNEKKYRPVAIYKIPYENYDILGSGWYTPNRPCCSIFVPFHICNSDIYKTYKSGDTSELSLQLFYSYGHDYLSDKFERVEEVFLYENDEMEKFALDLIKKNFDVSEIITISDMGMQKQAHTTEEIWQDISKISNERVTQEMISLISTVWDTDYSSSIEKMQNAIEDLERNPIIQDKLIEISINICQTKIDIADALGKETDDIKDEFKKARRRIAQGNFEEGFDNFQQVLTQTNNQIFGKTMQIEKADLKEENVQSDSIFFLLVMIVIITLIILLSRFILIL